MGPKVQGSGGTDCFLDSYFFGDCSLNQIALEPRLDFITRSSGILGLAMVRRGTDRVFRRGRIWWIAYSRSGREYRESSRSTDEKVARKMLQKRLATPARDSITVRDLARRPDLLTLA
jgi:hypothetical protein